MNVRILNGKPSTCTEKIDIGAYEFDPCPSDLDDSGLVDGGDLGVVLATWGQCQSCEEDINSDGIVDGGDLGIVLADWGPCEDGCSSSMMFGGGGNEEGAEGAAPLTPIEAAELLGFGSVDEFVAWLNELEYDEMASILLQLFGG